MFFGDRMPSSVAEAGRPIYSSTDTDLMVNLNAMAARSEAGKLVSLVMVLPFRHPVPLAKATASLHRPSQNRLILGVGLERTPPSLPPWACPGTNGPSH